MTKNGRNGTSARWITVLGSAAVALAIWAAVVNSPSATQSATQPVTQPNPTTNPNFSANDTFLTQPYVQSGTSYTQPIPQGSTTQSYPTTSRSRLRSRGS